VKVTLKVFHSTPPCAKCREVEKVATKVAERYPDQVEVAKFPAISDEGRRYGIMLTPGVVINDKVMATGKVVSESELGKAVKKELGGQ
jgi:thiol-disulfide isomerase/thioredoxin